MQLSAEISNIRSDARSDDRTERVGALYEPPGLSRVYDEIDLARKGDRAQNSSSSSSNSINLFQSNPFLDVAGMKLLRPGYTADGARLSPQNSNPGIGSPDRPPPPPPPPADRSGPNPDRTQPRPEQVIPPVPGAIVPRPDQVTPRPPEQKVPKPDQVTPRPPEQRVPKPNPVTPPRPEPRVPPRQDRLPPQHENRNKPLPGHLPLPPFVIPGENPGGRRDGLPPTPRGDGRVVPAPRVSDHQMPIAHAPTITPQKIDQVLAEYRSPAQGMGQKIFDLGVQYGINPAMALAFYIQESSAGTRGAAVRSNSWGNIRQGQGYRAYNNIEQGLVDWYQRISQFYIGKGFHTLGQPGQPDGIIHKYAPRSDGNNEGAYVRNVANMIRRWAA